MNFHINDFEGPLDLLLHLIKESKMDIYEIELSQVIKQYLDLIQHMQDKNIDLASSYLVMAAELIHLKSKSLLNQNDEEDDDYEINSEEDLKAKLILYEQYKNITDEFRNLQEKREEVYTKSPTNITEYNEKGIIVNDGITIEDLLNAYLEMQKREEYHKPLETKITQKEMSVSERTSAIREILTKKSKINFSELFEVVTKEYVIVTFLSILDMSKNKEILLKQENNFTNILIEKRV